MPPALDGVKILDLSMNLPGPYLTWLLAGMGAEVIKVENPVGGDYARFVSGKELGDLIFNSVNRNKKSLALNLKDPKGKELFKSLLAEHDVVVEGFRPGAMEKLGLDYESLRKIQPRLIMVSITGYGHDGAHRLRAGHDVNYLALSGVLAMTGAKNGEPAIPGVQVADLFGGSLMAMTGLLAALFCREKTGQGQFIDAAMFDGALSLSTMVSSLVTAGVQEPKPGRMLLNGAFPCYGLYKTQDGKWMSLGALEPKFWANFCRAVGRGDLEPEQFGGPEVMARLEELFARKTRDQWTELMREHDCCCEPVLDLNEAMASELTNGRGMVNTLDDRRYLAHPVKMSASPALPDEPAPRLGQHSREVLTRVGVKEAALEELAGRGVVGMAE